MADERCRDLSLAIDDGTGTGTFFAIARLRADHVTLDGSRRVLTRARSSASFARVALEGLGSLADEQGDVCLQRLFCEGASAFWQIRLPTLGLLEGPFRVARLRFRRASATQFDLALGSTDKIRFEPSALFAGDER